MSPWETTAVGLRAALAWRASDSCPLSGLFTDQPISESDRPRPTERGPLMTNKRDRERRTTVRATRFTPSEDARLVRLAEQRGLRIGDLLRDAALRLDEHA